MFSPKNKILTPKLIETAQGSYLHRFSWLDEQEVGEISKEWNYLVLEYPETEKAKIFHYTVGAPASMILIKVRKQNYGMKSILNHKLVLTI